MDKYEIATLADDYHSKKLRRDHLAMRNAYGLTPEEAQKLNIEFHIADAEMMEAYTRLEKAKFSGVKR